MGYYPPKTSYYPDEMEDIEIQQRESSYRLEKEEERTERYERQRCLKIVRNRIKLMPEKIVLDELRLIESEIENCAGVTKNHYYPATGNTFNLGKKCGHKKESQ